MEYNYRHSLPEPAYPVQALNMASSSSLSRTSQSSFIDHSTGDTVPLFPSDLLDPYNFGPVYSGGFSESEAIDIFQADFDSPYNIGLAHESRLGAPSASTSLSETQHYPEASRPEPSEPLHSRRIPCLVEGCKTTFANIKNRDRHLKHIRHAASPHGQDVFWNCNTCEPSRKLTRRDGNRRHGLSVHLVKKWDEWLDEYCRKIQAMKNRVVTREREQLKREREEKLLRECGRRSI